MSCIREQAPATPEVNVYVQMPARAVPGSGSGGPVSSGLWGSVLQVMTVAASCGIAIGVLRVSGGLKVTHLPEHGVGNIEAGLRNVEAGLRSLGNSSSAQVKVGPVPILDIKGGEAKP